MAKNPKRPELAFEQYLYPSLNQTSLLESIWSEEACQQIEASFIEENNKPWRALPKSDDSRDTIPLYKYRSFDRLHPERTEQVIREGRLWSPSIQELNDPMEAAVVFGSGSIDEWTVPAVTMLYQSRWCGCICFTYDAVCAQMWAHYADSHQGFVLKYNRAPNYLLRSPHCRPVRYRREITHLDIQNDPDIMQPLWVKSEAWEYEREVRLLYPRTNAYTAVGLLNPAGIIFGLRTPVDVKETLRAMSGDLSVGEIKFGNDPYKLKVHWYD
jgi:hypothetical protein